MRTINPSKGVALTLYVIRSVTASRICKGQRIRTVAVGTSDAEEMCLFSTNAHSRTAASRLNGRLPARPRWQADQVLAMWEHFPNAVCLFPICYGLQWTCAQR
ncbi:hypothetical protein CPB85DRAFT_1330491 [Mucidula mucida]|nr:hypothetical protein CPB85DRAFT_1330491 [Mucidula mucida]